MSESKTIGEALAAPFKPDEIEWRAGATNNKDNPTKALALAYITSRAVLERLDAVVGVAGWQSTNTDAGNGRLACAIGIKIDGEWIWKSDGAGNRQSNPGLSEQDASKGDFSDAFKRTAVMWGIGRYLYDLPAIWVPCEKRGRTVILSQAPKLPAWAIPAGAKQDQPAERKAPKTPAPVTNGTSNGKPASDGDQRVWPQQVLTAVMNAHALNAPQHARGMLNLSTIDPAKHPDNLVQAALEWANDYTERRDPAIKPKAANDENKEQAASAANKLYTQKHLAPQGA